VKVRELDSAGLEQVKRQTEIRNVASSASGSIGHGLHPTMGEIVLIQIDATCFLVQSDDGGSPLGEVLAQLEKI